MSFRFTARSIALAAGTCAAVWAAAPLAAQTTQPGAAQGQGAAQPEPAQDERNRGVLSTEERDLARRAAREDATVEPWSPDGSQDNEEAEAESGPLALVGEPLPAELPARRAPQSLVSKLPSRPRHEYWIFKNNLALVDKESREVSDIVRDLFGGDEVDEATGAEAGDGDGSGNR